MAILEVKKIFFFQNPDSPEAAGGSDSNDDADDTNEILEEPNVLPGNNKSFKSLLDN
jgi:hypothetical protein